MLYKLPLQIAVLLIAVFSAHASDFTVIDQASSAANHAGADANPWAGANSGAVEDGFLATNSIAGLEVTDFLRMSMGAQAFGLGQDIVITGIACQSLATSDIDDSATLSAYLHTGLSTVAGPLDASKFLTNTTGWDDSAGTVGGDGELWAKTQTQLLTYVSNKFFGCQFHITESAGNSPNLAIDAGRVVIYYRIQATTLTTVGAGR